MTVEGCANDKIIIHRGHGEPEGADSLWAWVVDCGDQVTRNVVDVGRSCLEFSIPGSKGCSDEDGVSEAGDGATEPSPVALTMHGGEQVAFVVEEISGAVVRCREIVGSSD